MKPVNQNCSFPEIEQAILEYWKEGSLFQESMRRDAPGFRVGMEPTSGVRKKFSFFDGPPFATGLPHFGHLLAGTIKDVIGRYATMRGLHADRRFGWDCHGVPIEFELQKTLELSGAKAIREFGVDKFNEACREIVLRYSAEWQTFVERSGRWVDFSRQYRTMDKEFMESVWWVLSQLWEKGLVEEGVKCVPYSPAINTTLSNFEANLNYKQVQDPAVVVTFPILESKSLGLKEPVSLLAWTTTPWTLPANLAAAVGEKLDYALVSHQGSNYILAKSRVESIFPETDILGTIPAADLVGLSYEPLFPYFKEARQNNAFKIYAGDFVSDSDGTGVVHLASFGEDDLKVFQQNSIPIIDPVDEDGCFTSDVPDYTGQFVKDADADIIKHLKAKDRLIKHDTIEHSYPFCWRSNKPLIYKSIPAWFVKIESIKENLIHSNSKVNWVPSHVKDGRMGKWLEGARDWAISRNRFWGTPIPIWRCDGCRELTCVSSAFHLKELSGVELDDLHSHHVDKVTWSCSACDSGTMKRIPEVLDCWFESGSMPYAQLHYPFENKEEFEQGFPADFIAEGMDQTRGWFYTLLALSTALYGEPAFKNVIVNGIVLAEDGKKMSKSLQNYPPPEKVLEEFGADAMRLYLLDSPACRGEEIRFSETGVKQVVRQHLLPFWNSYNFFVTYALVDNWTPAQVTDTPSDNILDRWILSRVSSLAKGVAHALDNYRLYSVAQPVLSFIDQLTNWYIRLNRKRFWASGSADDKAQAYSTLYQVLMQFSRILAPLAPFISEEVFQNLKRDLPELADCKSVHQMLFPTEEELAKYEVDPALESSMELFEEVILLGRSVRNDKGFKLRQPLASLTIAYHNEEELNLLKQLDSYIKEELNVKNVVYSSDESSLVELKALLNTQKLGRVLGPKLGSEGMKRLRDFVHNLSTEKLRAVELGSTVVFDDIELGSDDLLISREAKGEEEVASSGRVSILYDLRISHDLKLEGMAREFVNRVQRFRKEFGFEVADRIAISTSTSSVILRESIEKYSEYILSETLGIDITVSESSSSGGSFRIELGEIEGHSIEIGLQRVSD